MSQINVKINDDKQPICQDENEQTDDPMSKVNKLSILNESLSFNERKIQTENCRIVLGVSFSEQEVESLFFRITKLFASNSSRLRAMTYKVLKIIMQQKFIHMIFLCILKDLINENQFIKIEALKFIPFIQDEEYIVQLERFIHNALIDKNVLISSAALIDGIHIVNKYPNLVSKWQFEIVQTIDQKQENLNYHSLILFHEIKKTNLSQFIKIIILLIKKQLQLILHFQIIKCIKEILSNTENPYKQELITYLFIQVDSKDPLTAFLSSKILINNFEIYNNELISVQSYIEEHLYPQINNIEIYSALKLMHYLAKSNERQQLITQQQILLIQALSFNYRVTLSQMGILFFINQNSFFTGVDLKNLFEVGSRCVSKASFLKGIHEIIMYYSDHIILVLEFLKSAFLQERENELVELAIKLVVQILKVQKQLLKEAYPILFILADNPGLKSKSSAIKIINRILLNIQSTQLDYQKLNFWFQYLKESQPIEINQNELNFLRNQYIRLENYQSQLTQNRASLKKKQIKTN